MTDATSPPSSASSQRATEDMQNAKLLAKLGEREGIRYEIRAGQDNVWVFACAGTIDLLALRCGFGGAILGDVETHRFGDAKICDWRTSQGAVRLKVEFPTAANRTVRCTTSLLPARSVRLSAPIRDLFCAPETIGQVHTTQRGLRSGILYATCAKPEPCAILYLQNFSALTSFFEATHTSPADTVGGSLLEGGYLPPFGESCVLPESREFVLQDAYLALSLESSRQPQPLTAPYFDLLADAYLALERPQPEYHDWPARAERTVRDLSLSPACTYERGGNQYLMPYVGDSTKPPESMVQLTVLVNALEYEGWRGEPTRISKTLLDGIPRFYNPEIGSVVRWLPGADFGDQAEENMDHESMDSWYLYHSLFNLSRLAAHGNREARDLFLKSLPFAIRVARRFDYRWPIFFNLKTLEIVRAESEPGKGGEKDVAGIYALVMLHAHELFGKAAYFEEAKRAAEALRGLGFQLGYQTNTTGFAAEAMLRLWLLTKERSYLDLSELCMANIFDNMWLWQCDYGRARHYRTFFGLFPLHDAPYLAAYEELEAQAKFHEYLSLGGQDVRPSLRFLMAEYQKYNLDRGWFYYPDTLPMDGLAEKSRNGRIERALSLPLEDLQDGWTASGEVGQEIYGAGLAFVHATRHYVRLPADNVILYCSYTLYDLATSPRGARVVTFRTGGEPIGDCELRLIPVIPSKPIPSSFLFKGSGNRKVEIEPATTVEGHALYRLAGGTRYEVRLGGVGRKRRSAGPAA